MKWPFTDPSLPFPSAGPSPRKRIYQRMKHRNEKDKQMDKDKGELSKEEKKLRKKARKSSDSMRRHEGGHRDIVDGMIATVGISLSQASIYEKGGVVNSKGAKFCSQDAVKMYRNGTETDSDDE